MPGAGSAAGVLAGRLGRYGLGTAPLGGLFTPVSEQQAEHALVAAWQAGIRGLTLLIDPADRPC